MLHRITSILAATASLLESEGRLARIHFVRTVVVTAAVAAAVVVTLAGTLAVLVGGAWLLAEWIGVPEAIALGGATAIGIGIAVMRVAYTRITGPFLNPKVRNAPESTSNEKSEESESSHEQRHPTKLNGHRSSGSGIAKGAPEGVGGASS